ncbi:MAG: hypothetical protein V8R08_03290 [Coriobacteriales bacterium]
MRLREKGQASVEYLVVGLAFIALMGALAALWRFVATGGLSSLMEASASHALGTMGGLFDALLF